MNGEVRALPGLVRRSPPERMACGTWVFCGIGVGGTLTAADNALGWTSSRLRRRL